MERYAKQGIKYVIQLLHSICMFLLSLFFLWSFIVNLTNSHNLMDYLLTLMVLCFSLSVWASFYISIRSLQTVLFVNEDGMGVKRFNKTVLFIKYKDIREVGIGKAITPRGEKKKLYFAIRSLSQTEKNNLDLLQNEIIYFTYLNEDWKHYIEKHSNFVLDN